jgi:hypothetical protein
VIEISNLKLYDYMKMEELILHFLFPKILFTALNMAAAATT